MLASRPEATAKIAVSSGRWKTCVIAVVLSLQLFLLFASHLLPVSLSFSSTSTAAAECPLGRVYVYDLPPEFNRGLIDACDELNPWNSRCTSLSNSGFGVPSTDLAGIVPPGNLPTWFVTDQFAGEVIYHRRMLGHRCRSSDPSTATAFYVPFYAGFAVGKYLWSSVPNHTYTAADRDRLCELLLTWLSSQPYWRRSGGRDHFMMLGRITWDFRRSRDEDWGGSFLYMPGMANVTRLLIERDPWDNLDVGVPYPTGFHPRTSSDVRLWQDHVLRRNRSTLFCFAGAARRTIKADFRGILLSQCAAGSCRSLDCSRRRCANRTGETLGLFLDSEFCLQPRGDSFTRRSIFDCMIAGSIPVFFWRRSAVEQYQLYLPDDVEEYAVMLDRGAVRNGSLVIRAALEGIEEGRRRRLREKVVELIPKLVYAQPQEGLGPATMDAFDVAVDGVLSRFREQTREQQ